MKIYEIGTGYTPIPARMGAATEIVVEELTKSFIELGEQVEIIDVAAIDRLPHKLPICEVKVPKCFAGTDVKLGIMHKLKRVVYSVALALELKKMLKNTAEKVVLHFHNQYNMFFFLKLVPKSLRAKAVLAYTNHSGVWRLPWEDISEVVKKRYFQEAECMKKADIVFVLNEETKTCIVERLGVSPNHVCMIDNGVNTDIYKPLERSQNRKLFDFEGKRVILQVGSVYENKGQARVVEMLSPLLRSSTEYVYAYAGGIVSDEYHDAVKNTAKNNGVENSVHYLGMVTPGKELNELYNMAEVTILASEYESFGMVVIESLSAGTPVLIAEKFPHSFGEGTIIYTENNICDCIKQANLPVISDQARRNAVKNYSWEKVAKDYLCAWECIGRSL